MNNELTIESIFPTCITYINKSEFINEARLVFNEYSLISKGDNCINPIYPVIMTQNMVEEKRISELCNYILNTAWNILDFQGYNMEYYYTQFLDLWGQEHYRGSGMDYHIHGFGSQISGFYFIDVPKNTSVLHFHDPRAVKIYADLPQKKEDEITYATNLIHYKPKSGDLYFHNSWLPHSFTKNSNQQPLKFIHFNITSIPRHFIDAPKESEKKQPIVV